MSTQKQQRGFSLLELMISVTILTLVSGSVLLFMKNQQSYRAEQTYATAVENARIAIDTICRYLRQAGNNPQAATFIPLSYSSNTLTIRSDLTGSKASGNPLDSSGDPDKQLTAAFEQITVKYESDTHRILLDVGYGEDTLADNISGLAFQFLDSTGTATADMAQVSEVTVTMKADSSESDSRTGKHNSITLTSRAFLRSRGFTPLG